mgnify:CR=1 FL=1
MSEIEILEIELNNLKNGINNIVNAMNNINDIDELDEEYKQLDIILSKFESRKIDIEIQIGNLEEEAYYKENEEQWKKEKTTEQYEYWREAI